MRLVSLTWNKLCLENQNSQNTQRFRRPDVDQEERVCRAALYEVDDIGLE